MNADRDYHSRLRRAMEPSAFLFFSMPLRLKRTEGARGCLIVQLFIDSPAKAGSRAGAPSLALDPRFRGGINRRLVKRYVTRFMPRESTSSVGTLWIKAA